MATQLTATDWHDYTRRARELAFTRPISGPERPAEGLLGAPIAWFPVTGERGRHTATASGASLGLRVDSWEGGVRYIISVDGRTVREVDALPPEWRLGA